MNLTLPPSTADNSCCRGSGCGQESQGEQVGQRDEGAQTLEDGVTLGLRRRLDDQDGSAVGDMTSVRGLVTLASVSSVSRAVASLTPGVVVSSTVVITGVIVVIVSLIVVGVGEKPLLNLTHVDAGVGMIEAGTKLSCYVGERQI